MANVNIKFNGKNYLLSCDDGQEENLKELAGHLRKKFDELISTFEPDAVLIDSMSKFGLEVIKTGIPLFLILVKENIFSKSQKTHEEHLTHIFC